MKILIVGELGSGKTTYLDELCKGFKIIHRNADKISRCIIKYKKPLFIDFIEISSSVEKQIFDEINNYNGVFVFYNGNQIQSLMNAHRRYLEIKFSKYYNSQPVVFIANKIDNPDSFINYTQLFNIFSCDMSIKHKRNILKPISIMKAVLKEKSKNEDCKYRMENNNYKIDENRLCINYDNNVYNQVTKGPLYQT